jgi:zinc transporter 2
MWANSLAILSDAAHMFTDVAGFAVALAATIVVEYPGSENYTFGLIRAEVMGALASVMLLWLVTIFLVYNAYLRLISWFDGTAEPVDGFIMFVVACFGVTVNLILGTVFMEDHAGLGHGDIFNIILKK